MEKFEDDEIVEKYNLLQQNIEVSDDDDDDDDEYEEDSLLDIFLKKRSQEIYKNEEFVKIEGFNGSYTANLSMSVEIWKTLFDVIIDEIIEHVTKILESNIFVKCDYIFLVGGFASSLYYQERIKKEFNMIPVIIPELPQLCVVDGAARYGLRPKFMKIRRLSKTYGIKADKIRSNIKDENIFPNGYIDKHLDKVKVNGQIEEHIIGCFMIFTQKNAKIAIDDEPIIRDVLKQSKKQTKALIEIYESDKLIPAICEVDANRKGKIYVKFDKKVKKLWIEFDYSDTMFTVHAYPDGLKKSAKHMVRIDYE
eukprot:478817_1